MERYLPSQKVLNSVVIALLGLLIVGGGIAWLLTRPPAQAEAVMTYSPYTFGLQCQRAIEAQLKAPSTAQFESPWPVRGDETTGYAMNSYVDAENSFGAKLRQNYTCTSAPGSQTVIATLLN